MLKKLFATASNIIIVFGILALCGFAVLSFFDSKDSKAKLAALDVSLKEHGKQIAIMGEQNKQLVESNKNIVAANEQLKIESAKNAEAIKNKVQAATEAALNRPPILEECKPIAEAMSREIDQWKMAFSLALKDRDTQETIASNFELTYKNQVVVTDNLQQAMNMIITDSESKDEIIKLLRHEVKISKLKTSLVGGSMIVATVLVIILGIVK